MFKGCILSKHHNIIIVGGGGVGRCLSSDEGVSEGFLRQIRIKTQGKMLDNL